MQMLSNFWRWHNTGLKNQFGQDPIKLFFAKALASVLLTCSVVLVTFTLFFVTLDPSVVQSVAKVATAGINVFLVTSFAVSYTLLRRGKYDLARSVFVGMTVFGILFSITITGGFPTSSVSQCIIVVPVIVYLFYGSRAGTLTAVMSPVVVGLQWVAVKSWDVTLPNVSQGTDPALNLLMVTLIVYILLVFMVAGFEYRQSVLHKTLIHERKALARLASLDPLTGLYNFRHLHKEIDRIGSKAKEANQKFALLYIDMDNFKKINDQYGHGAGDQVLESVGKRISDGVSSDEVVARVGGDEFVILVPQVNSNQKVSELKQHLLKTLRQPIIHNGVSFASSASIGTAVYPDDTCDPGELLDFADRKMYAQKRQQDTRQLSPVQPGLMPV
jgi:diguanylate cyclase (GGDEF)-like protein